MPVEDGVNSGSNGDMGNIPPVDGLELHSLPTSPEEFTEAANKIRLDSLHGRNHHIQADHFGKPLDSRATNSKLGIPGTYEERLENGNKSAKIAAVAKTYNLARIVTDDSEWHLHASNLNLGKSDFPLQDENQQDTYYSSQGLYSGDRVAAARRLAEDAYLHDLDANRRAVAGPRSNEDVQAMSGRERRRLSRERSELANDYVDEQLEQTLGPEYKGQSPQQLRWNREPVKRSYDEQSRKLDQAAVVNRRAIDDLRVIASHLFDRDPERYGAMSNEEFVEVFHQLEDRWHQLRMLKYERALKKELLQSHVFSIDDDEINRRVPGWVDEQLGYVVSSNVLSDDAERLKTIINNPHTSLTDRLREVKHIIEEALSRSESEITRVEQSIDDDFGIPAYRQNNDPSGTEQ